MTDKTDLVTVPKGMEGMILSERPAGEDTGTLGNEGIGRDDILMPRLGLAQKMSYEIDATNQNRYIEGLKFMELFNSVTKKNYGTGPLHFVVLRRDDPRWIEFNPLEEGGGIKDRDVPPDDPRTQWVNGEKPVATMFYDFIVLLLTDFDPQEPLQNVIALSLKSSGIKAAKHLNFLIQQRGDKLVCKGVYELTTGHDTDKKSGGVYAIYKVRNAGWLKPDSDIEKLAIQMFNTWKDAPAPKIDRGDEDDSFDTAAMEREPAGARTDM